MLCDNLISPLIFDCRVGFLFCLRPPVEDHMMILCCFVMFCIWLQGGSPNSELNGVFVQHGSSPKGARVHMAASNKALKMSAEAQRQQTPLGSCCLPGTHLQIIYCGRRCQSVLSGHTLYSQYWVTGSKLIFQEISNNKNLKNAENIVVIVAHFETWDVFCDLRVWMDYRTGPGASWPLGPLNLCPVAHSASFWIDQLKVNQLTTKIQNNHTLPKHKMTTKTHKASTKRCKTNTNSRKTTTKRHKWPQRHTLQKLKS